MWVSAILAAGGRGTRMGAQVPKQLMMIGSRSILQRSFDALEADGGTEGIVGGLPGERASPPPPFVKSARKRISIVEGGATRHQSVANAFRRQRCCPVFSPTSGMA